MGGGGEEGGGGEGGGEGQRRRRGSTGHQRAVPVPVRVARKNGNHGKRRQRNEPASEVHVHTPVRAYVSHAKMNAICIALIDLHAVSQKIVPLDFQSKQQIFTVANREIVSNTITITQYCTINP